jgi:signal transduction histidine kinase
MTTHLAGTKQQLPTHHRADRRNRALAQERARIVDDVHSIVIQQLFSASLVLDAALRPGTADPGSQTEFAIELINAAIRDLRLIPYRSPNSVAA